MWKENRPKPVIGIAGGIGAGKSSIARMFGELGCLVVDSDKQAHAAIEEPEVKAELRAWLGDAVFRADGSVDRKEVGRRVFADAAALERLNKLVHPRVARRRDELMLKAFADPEVPAIVWDTPLLFETGLDAACDALVFVNALREIRLERVRAERGWGEAELARREKMQLGLDKKQNRAHYCVENSNDPSASLRQVQRVLSQILARKS